MSLKSGRELRRQRLKSFMAILVVFAVGFGLIGGISLAFPSTGNADNNGGYYNGTDTGGNPVNGGGLVPGENTEGNKSEPVSDNPGLVEWVSNFICPIKIEDQGEYLDEDKNPIDFQQSTYLPAERLTSMYGWRKVFSKGEEKANLTPMDSEERLWGYDRYGERHTDLDITSDEGEGLVIIDVKEGEFTAKEYERDLHEIYEDQAEEGGRYYENYERIRNLTRPDAVSAVPTVPVYAIADGTVILAGNPETDKSFQDAYLIIHHDEALPGHLETYSYYGGLYAQQKITDERMILAANDSGFSYEGKSWSTGNLICGEPDNYGFIRDLWFPTRILNESQSTYQLGKAAESLGMVGKQVKKGDIIGWVGGGLADPGAGLLNLFNEGMNPYTERHLNFGLYVERFEPSTMSNSGKAVNPRPWYTTVAKDEFIDPENDVITHYAIPAQNRPYESEAKMWAAPFDFREDEYGNIFKLMWSPLQEEDFDEANPRHYRNQIGEPYQEYYILLKAGMGIQRTNYHTIWDWIENWVSEDGEYAVPSVLYNWRDYVCDSGHHHGTWYEVPVEQIAEGAVSSDDIYFLDEEEQFTYFNTRGKQEDKEIEGLKKIYLPATIHTIAKGAFYNCNNLNEIEFYDVSVNKTTFVQNSGCNNDTRKCTFNATAVVLYGTQELNFIGDYAFANTVLDTLTYLGEEITLGDISYLGAIGEGGFESTAFTSIILPGSLLFLGKNAFYNTEPFWASYYDAKNKLENDDEKKITYVCPGAWDCDGLCGIDEHHGDVGPVEDRYSNLGIVMLAGWAVESIKEIDETFTLSHTGGEMVRFLFETVGIADKLFMGCENIKAVKYNAWMKNSGNASFFGCTKLRGINFTLSVVDYYIYIYYPQENGTDPEDDIQLDICQIPNMVPDYEQFLMEYFGFVPLISVIGDWSFGLDAEEEDENENGGSSGSGNGEEEEIKKIKRIFVPLTVFYIGAAAFYNLEADIHIARSQEFVSNHFEYGYRPIDWGRRILSDYGYNWDKFVREQLHYDWEYGHLGGTTINWHPNCGCGNCLTGYGVYCECGCFNVDMIMQSALEMLIVWFEILNEELEELIQEYIEALEGPMNDVEALKDRLEQMLQEYQYNPYQSGGSSDDLFQWSDEMYEDWKAGLEDLAEVIKEYYDSFKAIFDEYRVLFEHIHQKFDLLKDFHTGDSPASDVMTEQLEEAADLLKELEDMIWEVIEEQIELLKLLYESHQALSDTLDVLENELEMLEGEKGYLEERNTMLEGHIDEWEEYKANGGDADVADDAIAETQAEIDANNERLEEIEDMIEETEDKIEQVEELVAYIEDEMIPPAEETYCWMIIMLREIYILQDRLRDDFGVGFGGSWMFPNFP